MIGGGIAMPIAERLELFYKATGIPVAAIGQDGSFRAEAGCYSPNLAYLYMKGSLETERPPFATITQRYLQFGVVRAGGTAYLLGPVSPAEVTAKQAAGILKDFGRSPSRVDDLLRWFRQAPHYTNQRFRGAVSMLHALVHQGALCDVDQIPYSEAAGVAHTPIEPQNTLYAYIPSVDHSIETRILSCVEFGRADELRIVFEDLHRSNMQLPDFNLDASRTFQNVFVVSTTLAGRSAVQGGLDQNVSSTISDKYLGRVATIETYSDFDVLWQQMFLEFTRKVAACRRIRTDSLLVTQILKDIQAHLLEPLSARDIARRLGCSKEHLSRHFRQKTGMTLTCFIQQEKVTECRRLLAATDLSLSEIAARLGFSSQNYMHKVFGEHTKQTPMQYRKGRLPT